MTALSGAVIAVRVDASLDIGTGHVMRCLALAGALADAGATCHFISREHPGNLIDYIRECGHPVHPLPAASANQSLSGPATRPAHARWLGCDRETDTRETAQALRQVASDRGKVDWLIVDSYALDTYWEETLRPGYSRLFAIDDLADRSHGCDVLLDQNVGRIPSDYVGLVPESCRLLIGPRYALLRPEFSVQRPHSLKRRVDPILGHLLISMGGVDRPNATSRVLEGLAGCPLPPECRITVVIGTRSPWKAAVSAAASRLSWTVEVLTGVKDMARLMASSDLAIGAAGTTALERCCLGLPSLLVVLAENQAAGAEALQALGAARLLGEPSAIPTTLPAAIASFQNGLELARMSQAAREVTHGTGIASVVEHMRGIS